MSPRIALRTRSSFREGLLEGSSRRFGKHLWFELDRKPWPVFHFGMTGGFHFLEAKAESPRFLKLELTLDDDRRFAFTDPRRFGRLRLASDPRSEPPLVGLGHDPLFGLPKTDELAALIGSRKAPIKAVLLDQSTFAGVGNWIADEVLYQAAIRPQRQASDLSTVEVARLRSSHLTLPTPVTLNQRNGPPGEGRHTRSLEKKHGRVG